MEIEELLALNREGLIPGPGESEKEFLERVQAVKGLFHEGKEERIPSHHWTWSFEQLTRFFDFAPRWCSAHYSSKGLSPWQAAATWIDVKRIYTIQLRNASWVRHLIDRDEVLAHEATHAARAAFDEPRYEEVFAYMTSSAKWRKVLGPLFRKPGEALLLLVLVFSGSLLYAMDQMSAQFFYFFAAMFCVGWGIRLFWTRVQLERAAKRASPLLKNSSKVAAFLFRLQDAEIAALANGKPLFPKEELRWKILQAEYLKERI